MSKNMERKKCIKYSVIDICLREQNRNETIICHN